MRRMRQRIVSALLSVVMVCSLSGLPGYAEAYRDAEGLPGGESGSVEAAIPADGAGADAETVIPADDPDAGVEMIAPDDSPGADAEMVIPADGAGADMGAAIPAYGPGGADDVPAEIPGFDAEKGTEEILDAADGDGTAAGEGPTDEAAADAAGSLQDEAPTEITVEGIETVAEAPAEALADAGGEILLYVLTESYQDYISIPSGYLQTYDLGGHTGTVSSGDSVLVENQVVKPAAETWYYHQLPSGQWVGSSNPSGDPGEYAVTDFVYGTSTVMLEDGTTLTFCVKSYADLYSEQIIEQYLAEHITAGMTEYEKAELCCKFAAGYDYGTGCSTRTGMLVTGAGDCWASTDTLLYMLGRLGIACQSHDGSFEEGAGSGHVNVMAKLDGEYYILDAGFVGEAPRLYSMKKTGLYKYSILSSSEATAAITDFADMEGETRIEIPASLDGYRIVEISDGAFSGKDALVHVTIPDTVERIGDEAFANCGALETVDLPEHLASIGASCFFYCESLRELRLPASLTEIGAGCFRYCTSLQSIDVDAGNSVFSSVDGILFDKGFTKLLTFPAAKKPASYTVPASVQTIGEYAFQHACVKSLNFPAGLREIEPYAFEDYGMEKIGPSAWSPAELDPLVLPSGMTSVSAYAFASAGISEIVLPAGIQRIESYAFFRSNIRKINFPQGLAYIGEGAFAGLGYHDMTFMIPVSVKEISSYAFLLGQGWSSMDAGSGSSGRVARIVFAEGCDIAFGEEVFSAAVLIAGENSPVHQYAKEHGVSFEAETDNQTYGRLLDLKLSNEKDGIALSWNASGDTGQYEIYRKKQGEASFQRVQVTGQTSWTDAGIESGGNYSYRLEFTVGGARISTPQVSLWRLAAPAAVRTVPQGNTTSILWPPVEGADEYRIYYRAKGSTGYGYTTLTTLVPGEGGLFEYSFVRIENYDVWIVAFREGDAGAPEEVKPGEGGDTPAEVKPGEDSGVEEIRVSLSKKTYTYNGKARKPSVTVAAGGTTLKKDRDYTVKYSKNKAVGTAKVTVSLKGKYSGKITASFTINPPKTSLSLAKSTSAGKLTLKWKKVSSADGYQIQYALKKNFSGKKTVNVSRAKTVSKKLSGLKKGKTCYVRIRTWKKVSGRKYYSSWSGKKKVKILR